MELIERIIIFNVPQNSILCRFEYCFFQANGNVGFGDLNLVFCIILSEITIFRQGSYTLLLHFVLKEAC
jgi:hypothetical protein